MKKRNFVLSVVPCLLGVAMLAGCGGSSAITVTSDYATVDQYTQYLEKATADENELEASSYTEDDGSVTYYVDNVSDVNFTSLTLHFYDAMVNGNETGSTDMPLIRPAGYAQGNDSADVVTSYYDYSNIRSYTLNYPCDKDYTFQYDYDESNVSYNDIFVDDSYTQADVEAIAKKEYVINVLTNDMIQNYYFFDSTMTYDENYPEYPAVSSAVYQGNFDYSAKTITITDAAGAEVSKITMD